MAAMLFSVTGAAAEARHGRLTEMSGAVVDEEELARPGHGHHDDVGHAAVLRSPAAMPPMSETVSRPARPGLLAKRAVAVVDKNEAGRTRRAPTMRSVHPTPPRSHAQAAPPSHTHEAGQGVPTRAVGKSWLSLALWTLSTNLPKARGGPLAPAG